jgi:hypothetical protein
MRNVIIAAAFVLFGLMAFPALAQTNTYTWTVPANSVVTLVLPLGSTFTGPPAVTPDGTKSVAPSGASLTTGAGVWSWNTRMIGANYVLYLNGSQHASSDAATLIEVAHGGQLYAQTSTGWYVYNGAAFVLSAAP